MPPGREWLAPSPAVLIWLPREPLTVYVHDLDLVLASSNDFRDVHGWGVNP